MHHIFSSEIYCQLILQWCTDGQISRVNQCSTLLSKITTWWFDRPQQPIANQIADYESYVSDNEYDFLNKDEGDPECDLY